MSTAEAKLDRLSFEKIFHHREHLNKLVNNEETYPVHIQVGPTNFCNHDCTFCFARRSMFDSLGEDRTRIDVERLVEVMAEMHTLGLRAATLVGSGEPTLHPRIADIIQGVHATGVEVGMFTNGSCITDKTASAIAEHCTFVRFSLTGASPEIHQAVHANGDFDRIVANIEKTVAARKGAMPTLGSQFILASYSAKDVVEGARLAKSLGLDYYEIKPVYAAPGKADQLPNTLSSEEGSDLMREAKGFEDENFKVHAKVEQMQKVFVNLDDRRYDDCPGHKTSAVLEADLSMYICCNQRLPQFCFGDVREQSFKELWHGEQRQRVLNELNVHQCVPRCRQDPLNNIVHDLRVGQRFIPTDLPAPTPDLHANFI